MSKIIERVRQRAVQRFERVAAAFERELREGEHNARIEALLAAQPQEVKKAVLSSREGFMRVLRERTHDFPAPWPCFAGHRLHVGDWIQHPGGKRARVVFDPERIGLSCWRAVYEDGESLWLGNQIGDKGQATLVRVDASGPSP
ncbi:hypothetical protein UFOVP707_60 [uncultured Caudovirales phage]|uniref:Uncharacterized protein n=1 Tax=uncultured Caudovirales phage TaxID=2100421 RepID=A0A6J5NKE9_9CAUD|nr:hypothetical protein UFOVP707_60 [uncultured Caudovirales phage]